MTPCKYIVCIKGKVRDCSIYNYRSFQNACLTLHVQICEVHEQFLSYMQNVCIVNLTIYRAKDVERKAQL